MGRLEAFEQKLNDLDAEINLLLLQRIALVEEMRRYKERQNLMVYDARREETFLRFAAKDLPLYVGTSVQEIWSVIFRECRKLQFVYRQRQDR